jgi:hypothetical protein
LPFNGVAAGASASNPSPKAKNLVRIAVPLLKPPLIMPA